MALQVMVFVITVVKIHQWVSKNFQGPEHDGHRWMGPMTLSVLVAITISVWSLHAPRVVSLVIVVWVLNPVIAELRSGYLQRRKWATELPSFYDHALLEIRSGKGAREIFASSARDSRWSLRHRRILSNLLLSTPNETPVDPSERRRERELRSILVGGTRCGDRLQSFREQARIEERLARLKVRALRMAQVQSGLVVALFLGLSGIQATRDPNFFFSIWFKTGLFVLALGLAALVFLGKGFRWRT